MEPYMRDIRFTAIHRGGPLSKERHRLLVSWAAACTEHVLPLIGINADKRVMDAIYAANEWVKGRSAVGDARKASVEAIAAANDAADPIAEAVARSAGHAAASAHMADHSIIAADYALKAVILSGGPVDDERKWQDERSYPDISGLISSARLQKHLRLYEKGKQNEKDKQGDIHPV
jgi:hypothetical protein